MRLFNAAFVVFGPDGPDRRRLPQDAPGSLRRVRAAPETFSSSPRPLVEAVGLVFARRPRRCCCQSTVAQGEYRHLLRNRLSDSHSPLRAGRQPAPDDHHQRRVVWSRRRPYQHFAQAAMRAIENKVVIWCEPPNWHQCRRRSVRPTWWIQTGLFEAATIVREARFLDGRTRYMGQSATLRLSCVALMVTVARCCGCSAPRPV